MSVRDCMCCEAVSPLQVRSCSLGSQKTILEVMTTLIGNTCPGDFTLPLLPAVSQCTVTHVTRGFARDVYMCLNSRLYTNEVKFRFETGT